MKHTILLLLFSYAAFVSAQTRKKTYKFPECDTTNVFYFENVYSSEIRILQITADEITDWIKKNHTDTILKIGSEFCFVFDNRKGVCCIRLAIFDSTKAKLDDFTPLILRLKEYPKFKELANKCIKPKVLWCVPIHDKEKNKYMFELLPSIDD